MKKLTKNQEYSSPLIDKLLDEVTPLEMEKTKIKMQLAAHIEDMMIKKGWNKSELAARAGKNPSEITRWFSGTHNFTIDMLTEIAFVFGAEITTLFGKKPEMVTYKNNISALLKASEPVVKISTPMKKNSTDNSIKTVYSTSFNC